MKRIHEQGRLDKVEAMLATTLAKAREKLSFIAPEQALLDDPELNPVDA
ncbi:hypothetical protein [Rhizobium grahamii]|nr:hypothetical protein [Rhizobium grahamii]